jgi:DNA-3-methyladenine glycosylase II
LKNKILEHRPGTFHQNNFEEICRALALKEVAFQNILQQYQYPPMWTRQPTFATLVHIILEQQVSLASARAAFNKLQQKLKIITPQKVLALSNDELKACYFSRQKTLYVQELAKAIVSKKLNLKKLHQQDDETIRQALKQIKGIGDWTVDVYLLFALQRGDVFPTGDLAIMIALKEIKQLEKLTPKQKIIEMAEAWRPHRSVATMLLWHYYIKKRNIKFG